MAPPDPALRSPSDTRTAESDGEWEQGVEAEEVERDSLVYPSVADGLAEQPSAPKNLGRIVQVPLERNLSPTSVVDPASEQIIRVRREQDLVLEYGRYLEERGPTVTRLRLPLESTTFYNDVYVEERHQLIEAKGSSKRDAIRMAIGQLFDYTFVATQDGVSPFRLAILLPERPAVSIIELLRSERVQISVVWAVEDGFADTAGGVFM